MGNLGRCCAVGIALKDADDDSGGNTNARIIRHLAAGTYYMVAKPFGDYTSHGAYTLIAAIAN